MTMDGNLDNLTVVVCGVFDEKKGLYIINSSSIE